MSNTSNTVSSSAGVQQSKEVPQSGVVEPEAIQRHMKNPRQQEKEGGRVMDGLAVVILKRKTIDRDQGYIVVNQ